MALVRSGGAWSLSAPKTPKSRRRIALSANAIAALKRQRSRQAEARLRAGQAWTDYDLVFTDDFGEPLTGSRITERRLRPLVRREGLPPIRFHAAAFPPRGEVTAVISVVVSLAKALAA